MALQQTVNLDWGGQVVNAYHRVKRINIDVDGFCSISVEVFKDATSRQNNDPVVLNKGFNLSGSDFTNFLTPTVVDPLNINHVAQAYDFLKTLPDYSGAVDC